MSLYPRLMWRTDGGEITVMSAEEFDEKLASGEYRAIRDQVLDDEPVEAAELDMTVTVAGEVPDNDAPAKPARGGKKK